MRIRTGKGGCGRPVRRGYGLIELTLSAVLLMAAMTFMVKMLAWVGAERHAAERRQWAALEIGNAMERLVSRPFDEVTADRGRELLATIPGVRDLKNPDWQATVSDEPSGPLTGRRVTFRLRWKTRSGEWDAPVVLSAWVFKGGKS